VDVPIATISIRFPGLRGRAARRAPGAITVFAGGALELAFVPNCVEHRALIFGIRSARICSIATAGLPVLLGFVA
jgi:hypothetical protein